MIVDDEPPAGPLVILDVPTDGSVSGGVVATGGWESISTRRAASVADGDGGCRRAGICGPNSRPADTPGTSKGSTEVVQLDVTVLGADGRPLESPTTADFPALAGNMYTTTALNLSAYRGMATAAANAAETGLFWSNTAVVAGQGIAVGLTGVSSFATTADVYSRVTCRNVQ